MKRKIVKSSILLLIAGVVLGSPMPLLSQIKRDTTQIKALPRVTGWLDNSHYTLERYTNGKPKSVAVNIFNGDERTVVDTALDKNSITVKIIAGDIFCIDQSTPVQLTRTVAEERLAVLSPDQKRIAFLRDNDLYSIELSTGLEHRYTFDGSADIMNGYASWVYYEEILKRDSQYRAFWWSPDSKYIAFYRFDDSDVPVFALHNPIGQHGFTENTRYPKAGDPNPKVRVGIVNTANNQVQWAAFDEQVDQYFGKPIWRPDASGLLVQWMPRRQNNLKLIEVNPITGTLQEIYDENQNTWIDWINRFYWTKEGFVVVRDFEGWEQIYAYDKAGKKKEKLTKGNNWQLQIHRIDEKSGFIYYSSTAELATRTDFYRVGMDGKNQKRLTIGAYHYSNINLSPDGKYFITQYSNVSTPPKIALIETKSGKIKVIGDAKGADYNPSKIRKREIVWMQTPDGFSLPASITWPLHMDANKKYPVSIRIYGGPKYQTVEDSWADPNWSKQEEEEEIKVIFEHRGAGFNGKAGLDHLYGNLGKWEMCDYINWIKQLRQYPQVDSTKVMISGGSYGGYLTSMALTYGAGYFNYGIADYPVTDWALYDSHYTERYMGLPKDNPTGYAFGSVLNHIDSYQTKGPAMLLIQHGVMDDNVHIQHTYQLVDAFQRNNKSFELMVYPTERHGWKGPKIPFTVDIKNSFVKKYIYK